MIKTLIIDDEIDICFLLSSILKTKDMHPTFVNSLVDAIPALEKINPSIVFLDNHLPDGMGIDFIQHIKENFPSTKIIMITAYDNLSDRKKAFQLGADEFISKPFSRDIIYKTVEHLVN